MKRHAVLTLIFCVDDMAESLLVLEVPVTWPVHADFFACSNKSVCRIANRAREQIIYSRVKVGGHYISAQGKQRKYQVQNPQVGGRIYKNQLIGAFAPDFRARLTPFMERVNFKLGATVCDAGGELTHAYFPEGCVLSLLTVLENGSEIECANIGREGAFGLFAAMYSGVSFNRCTVQLEGSMLRCDIKYLREEFRQNPKMQDLLVSYSETLLSQVMQTVACNSLHSAEERLSRWLLMMHDRAEGEKLTYTHEFLARVMGANRTSITLTAQSLQNNGLRRSTAGSRSRLL